jgi:predicted Zn-dependent protease|tara:strand:+ start:313 stop:513 length:201 start_codon:yes stop_codon:yes gene_type:complete
MFKPGARWSLHVVNSPVINACYAPGGHVFVNVGLLNACVDNMLAFVFAHEMAHGLCRHHAEKATSE